MHGVVIDKTIFTTAILSLLFREFVAKTHTTTEALYNMLLTWNGVAESYGVSVIMWAIEQMGCTGASTALMIADVCVGLGIQYEVLC